jgi:ubiquinone/menaquinone biosynthesis C-methylase UbiE
MVRVSAPFVLPLLAACQVGRGGRLLDVGTGTGLVAAAAAIEHGAAVVALDLSPAMLAHARARVGPLGIPLVAADTAALPCRDESFDAATCHLVLVFVDRPAVALAELHRVLRPGGRVAATAMARPETTAYGPVLEALGRHAARPREVLSRLCSLGGAERLATLLARAGFHEARIERVARELRWASFAEYWSVIEAGGGLAGQEYRALPEAIRRTVREDVQRRVAGRHDAAGLAWTVEVILAAARR